MDLKTFLICRAPVQIKGKEKVKILPQSAVQYKIENMPINCTENAIKALIPIQSCLS